MFIYLINESGKQTSVMITYQTVKFTMMIIILFYQKSDALSSGRNALDDPKNSKMFYTLI